MPVTTSRRPRSHTASALTLAGLLLAVSHAALAQSFIGRGAPRVLAVPDAERAGRLTAAVRAEAEPASPPAASPPAASPLPQRPFPALSSSLRLSGEESGLQWPVYLTEAQSREHLRLRIGYLAAISVVPDASFLTAKVNGVAVGRSEIKAPGAIRIIEFDIPGDLLKPGYNALEIAAVQRHRVDCSLDATYELWTQIDPAWTGLVSVSGAAMANSLRDLPAIAPDTRGIVPIRIVLRNRPGFATFERLIGLVQRLALAGKFSQVSVEFANEPQGSAGLEIHVADDGGTGGLGRQPLTFEPPQGDRPARITLAGDTPAEVEAASRIVSGITTREPMGSPQGLQAIALARGVPAQGRETVPLSAFGIENREFGGRLFRTGFDLTLPTDFVPADYDKIALTLAGGYAAGLEIGAQIIVDVNGRNVASVPLANAGGALFRDETIALPLSRWRPGRNKVEVKALLPAPSDRACEGGSTTNRFLFLNRSTLAVPQLARAIRLPDLAATLGGGLPKIAPGQRPRLVVPAPDRESMAAAATLAVQMALSAENPIDFELTNDRALEGRTPTVVVGAARALDPAILRTTGLDPDQIRQIWQGRAATTPSSEPGRRFAVMDGASLDRLRNDRPPACALPVAGPRQAGVVGRSRSDSATDRRERDIIAEWNGATASQDRLSDQVATMSARLGAAARESWVATKAWAEDQIREPKIEIGSQASLIVSQGLPGRDRNGLLTVFTAPSAATLQASAICLTTPSIWNRIEGRIATLDANDGALTNHPAKQARFVESGPVSMENLRLVVAGWFSTNPSMFTLIMFAAAISLGLSTSAMLRGLGRANPGNAAPAKSDDEGSPR